MTLPMSARWRATLVLVGLFWATWYGAMTTSSFFIHAEPAMKALQRLAPVSFGAAMCIGVAAVLRILGRRPFWQRATVATVLILPVSMAYAGVNALMFGWAEKKLALHVANATAPAILVTGISWMPTFLCWCAIFLALEFSFDVQERERRIAELRVAAERAQLLALRYQINPHFLFNAHNAVIALIATGEGRKAEATLRHLSVFLRSTLEMDPMAHVRLDQEIELTRLYLKVEQVRFPTRLRLLVDVSAAAAAIEVPSLILQPLVENAVKHGVERSSRRTTITIAAAVVGRELSLTISDDGEGGAATASGLGVGLENVRSRLALIYGDAAKFQAAPRPPSGFAVRITLPFGAPAYA